MKGPVAAPAGGAAQPQAAPVPAPPAPSAAAPAAGAARPAPAAPPAEAAPAAPPPPAHVLTDEERKRIMDDKKLNDFMGVFKGAQITSLK